MKKHFSVIALTLLMSATQAHTFKCSTCGKQFSAVELKANSQIARDIKDLGQSIGGAFKDLGSFFSATTLTFVNKTKDAGVSVKDGIASGYTKTKEGFKTAAIKTKDGIINSPKNIKDGIVNASKNTKDGIQYAMARTGEIIAVSVEKTGEVIKTSGETLEKNSKNFRPESYIPEPAAEITQEEEEVTEETSN